MTRGGCGHHYTVTRGWHRGCSGTFPPPAPFMQLQQGLLSLFFRRGLSTFLRLYCQVSPGHPRQPPDRSPWSLSTLLSPYDGLSDLSSYDPGRSPSLLKTHQWLRIACRSHLGSLPGLTTPSGFSLVSSPPPAGTFLTVSPWAPANHTFFCSTNKPHSPLPQGLCTSCPPTACSLLAFKCLAPLSCRPPPKDNFL